MRSDSKRDGIKREHVISQACLRSRHRRANYVYVSASDGQIWSWDEEGGGEEREFWKNVRTSGKILATPLPALTPEYLLPSQWVPMLAPTYLLPRQFE